MKISSFYSRISTREYTLSFSLVQFLPFYLFPLTYLYFLHSSHDKGFTFFITHSSSASVSSLLYSSIHGNILVHKQQTDRPFSLLLFNYRHCHFSFFLFLFLFLLSSSSSPLPPLLFLFFSPLLLPPLSSTSPACPPTPPPVVPLCGGGARHRRGEERIHRIHPVCHAPDGVGMDCWMDGWMNE